jgi:hypothetical protein
MPIMKILGFKIKVLWYTKEDASYAQRMRAHAISRRGQELSCKCEVKG